MTAPITCPYCGNSGYAIPFGEPVCAYCRMPVRAFAYVASGTDARQRQDREDGLDSKGDGPTPQGDAQTPPPSTVSAIKPSRDQGRLK